MVSEDTYSDLGYSAEANITLLSSIGTTGTGGGTPGTTTDPGETTAPPQSSNTLETASPKTEGATFAMPKRTTGITSQSLNSFVIDAGAVYVNLGETDERLLGATKEGSTFTIEAEMREMEIDGVRQAIKGTKRIINVLATLTVNLLELSAENLSLALVGSELTEFTDENATDPTHDVIRRAREIGTMDYIKNIAIVGKVNNTGDNFVGLLYNALSSGGLEMALEDENEAAIELTFTAHIDADDIADDGTYTEAWEIRMPKPPTP